ncbi:NUDIX domain-containing protein [Listeria ilorinensis]|uniref:NUDIX domain-containing protein n=1 Tax=Listeria ilorinensis TaxID=2867439 RepID=UPI001EF6E625|nr:NUDIX domain-containing protein [Listeria ilorinensis]
MKHTRTCAVINYQGKILLHRSEDSNHYAVPGGAVERETTREALLREMQEELGKKIRIGELLFLIENYFSIGETVYDAIEFYYQVDLVEGEDLYARPSFTKIEHYPQGEQEVYTLHFVWVDQATLQNLPIEPVILKKKLLELLQYEEQPPFEILEQEEG